MKRILKDKIINSDQNKFDNKFIIEVSKIDKTSTKVIFMEDLLKPKRNEEVLKIMGEKYAMYSNVYSPKDELEIFTNLFENAIKTGEKIHIVGISLKEEVEMLEKYYEELGFRREDVNCYNVDFEKPLVTASVKIENLIWKGSDYKKMKEKIFFIPPPRESGQNKAMFKGLNKGVIAGIYLEKYEETEKEFFTNIISSEAILPLRLAKILNYNFEEIGIKGSSEDIIISY